MLISIIVPVYKVEKYIHPCVESVTSQDFEDYEIILVDDGSPDECGKICDKIAEDNSKITVIHKENGGLSDARNVGIGKAKGDYILFLDSDDQLLPNALTNISNLIKKYNPQVVAGTYNAFDDNNGKMLFGPDSDFSKINGVITQTKICDIFASQNVSHCAWRYVVKRNFLISNNLYFEKGLLSEDAKWTPQLLCFAKSFVLNDVPFYKYNVRDGSIMTTYNFKKVTDAMYICDENYKLAESQSLEVKTYICNLCFMCLLRSLENYNDFSKQEKNIVKNWLKDNKVMIEKFAIRKDVKTIVKAFGALNSIRIISAMINIKNKF